MEVAVFSDSQAHFKQLKASELLNLQVGAYSEHNQAWVKVLEVNSNNNLNLYSEILRLKVTKVDLEILEQHPVADSETWQLPSQQVDLADSDKLWMPMHPLTKTNQA